MMIFVDVHEMLSKESPNETGAGHHDNHINVAEFLPERIFL